MSTYRKEGKDVIIFATAEDHKKPSTVILPEAEPQPGLILPNGEINWNCPCLGGMATGPCGVEFREAFSCFHNSEADPKGSDCYDAFKEMHLCMAEYPQLYSRYDEDDEEDIDKALDMDKTELSLSVDSTSNQSEEKVTTKILSEEKSPEKKSTIHSEPKVSKPFAVDENLKVNFQNVKT